jgi:6-phosphofructokinase 1
MQEPIRVFISYAFEDQDFVLPVAACLKKQSRLSVFCYHPERFADSYPTLLSKEILNSDAFVVVHGARIGETQRREIELDFKRKAADVRRCLVLLGDAEIADGDRMYFLETRFPQVHGDSSAPGAAEACARQIVERLARHDEHDRHDLVWEALDGLPEGYIFDYEKDVIEAYRAGGGRLDPETIMKGCPGEWPRIAKLAVDPKVCPPYPNPVPEPVIGRYREEHHQIVVDARCGAREGVENGAPKRCAPPLTVLEAGPRAKLAYPGRTGRLGVGILVSGGIAPGINAVIAGVVNRHFLYHDAARKTNRGRAKRPRLVLNVWGIMGGFKELLPDRDTNPFRALTPDTVEGIVDAGGSCLTTSRADELLAGEFADRDLALTGVLDRLRNQNIDILYVIGGDGSMRAAHALWKRARSLGRPLSVVAIPKTMDNDVLWVWQSFGFLSAVEVAKRTIMQLQTEVRSNPRLCVLQLFGSDSGFVVSHAVLASGTCLVALIPEIRFRMKTLVGYIQERLGKLRNENQPYGGIVAMAETAVPVDWKSYRKRSELGLSKDEWSAIERFEQSGRRIRGQTPDALRTGGLRLVSRVLQQELRKTPGWGDYRVFTNEPRHLIRTIRPSVSDVITAQRMGSLAVDNAMAGYTDFMISQWLTEYVLIPLDLVVLGRKRVPQDGIFWKSVLASTGQPKDLVKT